MFPAPLAPKLATPYCHRLVLIGVGLGYQGGGGQHISAPPPVPSVVQITKEQRMLQMSRQMGE